MPRPVLGPSSLAAAPRPGRARRFRPRVRRLKLLAGLAQALQRALGQRVEGGGIVGHGAIVASVATPAGAPRK